MRRLSQPRCATQPSAEQRIRPAPRSSHAYQNKRRRPADALDQKTAALCREPRGGATYVLLTDEGPIPVCAPPEYLEALYSISDKIGRDVEALVQDRTNLDRRILLVGRG